MKSPNWDTLKIKKPKTQNKSKKMILCVIVKSIIKPLKENPIIKL